MRHFAMKHTYSTPEPRDTLPDADVEPRRVADSRQFVARAFCAVQYWCEEMSAEFIAGPHCTIQNPTAVADLLSAEWYKERWEKIPMDDLLASSVPWGVTDGDGNVVEKAVLMHKRRVPESALAGESAVSVCQLCREALWKPVPTLPRYALTNDL